MIPPDAFFIEKVIVIDDSNNLGVRGFYSGFRLAVRFKDNGANEEVWVRLFELDSSTGKIEELIRFDSDDFEGKSDVCSSCTEVDSEGFKHADVGCDFLSGNHSAQSFNKTRSFGKLSAGKAYFVQAVLKRTSVAGKPALSTITIDREVRSCG